MSDPLLYGTDADAERLLRDAGLWFIVGLGNNPDRAAYGVALALQGGGAHGAFSTCGMRIACCFGSTLQGSSM